MDVSPWDALPRRQQQVLTLMLMRAGSGGRATAELRPGDVAGWFGVNAATARDWLREWADSAFVHPIAGAGGLRVRRYRLAAPWSDLVVGAAVRPDREAT